VVIVSVPLRLCDWVRELRFTTEAKIYREFPIQVHPYKIARSRKNFCNGKPETARNGNRFRELDPGNIGGGFLQQDSSPEI
jgi:hypothetical protein